MVVYSHRNRLAWDILSLDHELLLGSDLSRDPVSPRHFGHAHALPLFEVAVQLWMTVLELVDDHLRKLVAWVQPRVTQPAGVLIEELQQSQLWPSTSL